MEYDLAVLTVSYLSLPEIDREKEDWETEKVLLQGNFSFYEYAVSLWGFHLEARILGTITKDLLDQLAESLEVFLDLYWTSPSNTLVASKTMQEKLQPLREFDFHSKPHRLLSLPETSLVVTDRAHPMMRPLASLLLLLNSEQSSRNWFLFLLT